MKNKKVLFITYYFPPIKAIGSLRSYFFAKNLNAKGWNVSIITTSGFKYLINDNFLEKLKGIRYIYIPSFDLQMIKVLFFKRQNIRKKTNKKVTAPSYKSGFFEKLRNSFPFYILYEGGFLYVLFGFIFGLYYVKKNNIRYIYSTYSPYSNHLIAYLIKKINKDCFWVADFRDLPFGDSDSDMFFKSFQTRLNNKIFKSADMIITISKGLESKLQKYNRTQVITNGFEIEDLYPDVCISKKFNIVYTGSLYKGKRDALILFRVIQQLIKEKKLPHDTKLIYAGNDSELWRQWAQEYDLEDNIEIKGFISRKETVELQKTASINLMLTWSTKKEQGILTGKLFEYLKTLNPIVCIINGNKDIEIESVFDSLNCGYVVYQNEIEKLSQAIEEIYKTKKIEYNLDELQKYSYPFLVDQLEDIYLKNRCK